MSDVVLLDGSIGQELVNRHDAPPTRLWGVQVMMDAPDTLASVHLDYFSAGANVATMNTYNLLRDRLAPVGLEDQFESLHRQASTLACRARDQHGSGFVAASLGPLGASYRPDLLPGVDEAAELYAEIARLHEADADILILETVSSIDSARAALLGAGVTRKPIWLALSVEDSDGRKLRSGEAVADVIAALGDLRFDALLFNCSTPEAIDVALGEIGDCPCPTGAYANGFTEIVDVFRKPGATVDVLSARTDLGPDEYADFALSWVDGGARVIGGCCEVGPAHIAEISARLYAQNHKIIAPT